MRNDEGNGQLPAFTGGHNNVNAIHLVQLKLELLHLIHKARMCDSGQVEHTLKQIRCKYYMTLKVT